MAFEPLCSSSFACSGTIFFFFFLLNLHLKEARSSPLMAASGSSTANSKWVEAAGPNQTFAGEKQMLGR